MSPATRRDLAAGASFIGIVLIVLGGAVAFPDVAYAALRLVLHIP